MHLFDLLNIAICIYFYQFEDFLFFIFLFLWLWFLLSTLLFFSTGVQRFDLAFLIFTCIMNLDELLTRIECYVKWKIYLWKD